MRFEWPEGERWVAWLWVPVLALVAMPWPIFPTPLPERAIPMFVLLTAAGLALALRVSRASWPFAALLVWAFCRMFLNQFYIDPISPQAGVVVLEVGRARPLQLLVLLAFVSVLYVIARELRAEVARWAAWALVVGAAWEFSFGLINAFGRYPFMSFVMPDQVGRPMGFLTHPNYFGSYLALTMPVVAALGGLIPAAAVYALICYSWSGGPVISASAGALVLLWPELGRRTRYVVIAGFSAAIAAVMTVHEWRLSGRREVWEAIWPELIRYPLIGQGLGSWRIWADHYNAKLSAVTGQREIFATLQAHNEPYQLWFELGLIGVALAACWAAQAWLAARTAWGACPPGTGALWAPGRLPLERAWIAIVATAVVNSLGSPTFHLPAQAAITLFALARIQAHAADRIEAERLIAASAKGRRRRRQEIEVCPTSS